jgi:hypothetical protein
LKIGFIARAVCAIVMLPMATLASVTIGGLSYSLQAMHTASTIGPEGMESHANGEYIVIRLKVSNVGNDPATISSSDFKLRGGSIMFDSANKSIMVDGAFFLTKLNPGTARAGTILFDVPANTSLSSYELQVFGNGGSKPTYMRL